MKRVKGTVRGGAVVLDKGVEAPPDETEVEVLIPEPEDVSLEAVLENVLRNPPAEVLTDEEVVEIVHRVRARRR